MDNGKFLYDGYKMTVFPGSVDKMTPKIGYLLGPIPWKLSDVLGEKGAQVMNTKADKSVCLDRRLIIGGSPLASNELGKLAATTLLDQLE